MVVISDTSVITNLIQLDQLTLLKELFENIVIPQKVFDELSKVPEQIKSIDMLHWIEVKQISNVDHFKRLLKVLDPGEAEAIVLAIELKADAKDFLDSLDEKSRDKILYNVWKSRSVNDKELLKSSKTKFGNLELYTTKLITDF